METLTEERPVAVTASQQFSCLLAKLKAAGYSLDDGEINRLRREFGRGTYNGHPQVL